LLNATVFAAIPLTVKSLAWTVAVFTASVRLIMKSTGWVLMVLLQAGVMVVTEQPVGVGVAVAVAVAVGVAVGVAVAVGVGVVVAQTSVYCWLSLVGLPGAESPATA